jgi:hypothetical protein
MNQSTRMSSYALLSVCALSLNARAAAAEGFVLQFHDGLVTLEAHEISIPKILDLWSRIGHTTIVNGEKIDGLPVTLQFVDIPEREALAIILRNVGGYILAPRPEGLQGVSAFDRIFVVQASRVAMRDPLPPPTVQPAFSASSQNPDPEPATPGQSAEAVASVRPPVGFPQGSVPQAGPASFGPQGTGPRGPTGMQPAGTARPGEMPPPPPPPSRSSPGPQRPPG